MAITNFGELQAAIAARAVRTDLAALLPDFVQAAHDVIVGKLAVSADIAIDADPVALPADFRTLVQVVADVQPAAPLELATERQMVGGVTGVPRRFRVDGSTLVLWPTPCDSFTGRILYKLDRAMFVDAGDTNTALQRYPTLYLYGSMAELFTHTRNQVERDRYLQLFLNGVDAACAVELEDFLGPAPLQPIPGMVV